jgi:hypothetical protein
MTNELAPYVNSGLEVAHYGGEKWRGPPSGDGGVVVAQLSAGRSVAPVVSPPSGNLNTI